MINTASLTLITGSIDGIEDPFDKLDYSELYYEFLEVDPYDLDSLLVRTEQFPIKCTGFLHRIIQYLGSGKTLMGMHILTGKHFLGKRTAANLGLAWDNFGKPKNEWTAKINTIQDFADLDECTILLDDIRGTISHFACKEAEIISEIANAGRKERKDIVSTAQREIMFPKDIRDMATEWIVPVIRVRDMTQWTPDETGKPLELVSLHFDGSKAFTYMSDPIINLDRLFESYSTLQRAIGLKVKFEDKNKKVIFKR